MFVQITADGLAEFDGAASSLVPLTEISLRGISEINILASFGEQITLSASNLGRYEFFVGYATDNSPITFTEVPIVVEVNGQ